MTPAAMARTLIHAAYRKNTHPDIPFIAEATGLPAREVSNLAAMERPLTPDRADTTPTPAPGAVESSPPVGPVRSHHITAMHDVRHSDGTTIVLVGCVCGRMLRAGVKELPRHWERHRLGLP